MMFGSYFVGAGFSRPGWTAALALCAALIAGACDKVPLLAPTESTIAVTAPTGVLPVGGSTEIQAFVLEKAGTPVQNGTTVRFTTTLGTLAPFEAQTRNGVATTIFSSNTSGNAEIRANSGSATGGTANSNIVKIAVGAAAVATSGVTVSASPSSVPPSGGTVNIDAFAVDTNGNRIVGVPVSFSTTGGTLSSGTAVTDANGNARVQLTTNAAATVTARVGAVTGTANVTVGAAISLALATAPNPAIASQPMTLTVTPAANTAPRVVVSWGDGNTEDLGIVAAARGVTHTYTNPGVYSITATATGQGDSFSTATTVTVGARPGPTVTLTTNGTRTTASVFTVTPAPNTAVRNVSIDFGDGTNPQDLGAITAATQVSHQYPNQAGNYVARVTQTDVAGNQTFATVVVAIP